jgi:hypothetical protein
LFSQFRKVSEYLVELCGVGMIFEEVRRYVQVNELINHDYQNRKLLVMVSKGYNI